MKNFERLKNKRRKSKMIYEYQGRLLWASTEVRDYYKHIQTGYTFIRVTSRCSYANKNNEQWILWLCPALKEGFAKLSYWIKIIKGA
jgi:uncharacterized pyridoxamine 5'-phosphate oxidase family protein